MKKKFANIDLLESAKIMQPVFAAPVPAPAVTPVVEAAPLPAPVKAGPERYRVKRTTTVSVCGQIVTLPADSIVSADIYGPKGFACILESNAPLEKL